MYTGKEVCQGCKNTGEESVRESKNDLCHKCYKELRLGRAKEIEIKNNYTYVAQFYHALSCIDFDDNTLNSGLLEVLNSIDNKEAESHNSVIGLIGNYFDNSFKVKIPSDLVAPIKTLFEKLQLIAIGLKKEKQGLVEFAKQEAYKQKNEIYQSGVEHGKNLLVQLNLGEISISDLNKNHSYNGI